jgi:asparagine synthase (glutamine-hydrolysing)
MDAHAFLGHRRLAIIDRIGGLQPMQSPCGRFVVTYNGEIYNFRAVRDELRQRGHGFSTNSDTEVVLHAFVEWGADSVKLLNGIFAYAVLDRQERQLWLLRDRLGVKPLYYSRLGRQIFFASEMKSLTAHPRFARQANMAALSSYLTFRTVVGSDTVFEGIASLPAGCTLNYRDGELRVERYWTVPHPVAGEDLGEDYYFGRTGELLRAAVARQMVSDVPVGAYLSGGVDSSLLVALMREVTGDAPKTFSIGFDADGYDESAFATIASRHIGTEHRHLVLGADAYRDGLETLVRHRDQPLSIPHEVALHALSKELKRDVTVCLSGEGADELFGGYGRVQGSPFDFARLRLFHRLPNPIKSYLASMVTDPDIRARLKITQELDHFFHVYNWWSFEDKQHLLTEDAKAAIGGDIALRGQFRDMFARLRHCGPYDRIFHVFETVHLPNLLDRLDMQSMAASVEARVPFTDHELVEFVSRMPIRYKIRWNSPLSMLAACFCTNAQASERFDTTKYLLRRLADRKLPPSISRRKKLGFPVPLDNWLAHSMHDYAAGILLDERTRQRGIFQTSAIETMLLGSRQSPFDGHGKRIWMLMNVELWFRNHIDRPAQTIPLLPADVLEGGS